MRSAAITVVAAAFLCVQATGQADDAGLQLINARFAMVAKDLRLNASATDVQIALLKAAFHRECAALGFDEDTSKKRNYRSFVERLLGKLMAKEGWSNVLGEHLTQEQRTAYHDLGVRRRAALAEAQGAMATIRMATELRLRAPQVQELRGLMATYVDRRSPHRSQRMAEDIVGEVFDETICGRPIRDWMLPTQIERCERMRASDLEDAVRGTVPEDDLELGRGRFEEDDYGFELDALIMFHGWDPKDTGLMGDLGVRLAREERRSLPMNLRRGSPTLFTSVAVPADSALWRTVLADALEELGTGAGIPDPGPYTGAAPKTGPGPMVAARVELITRCLEGRVYLQEDQLEAVRAAFLPYVQREFVAQAQSFGAIDEEKIFGQFFMATGRNPRQGSNSRKRLAERLVDVLDPAQEIELLLWVRGMADVEVEYR